MTDWKVENLIFHAIWCLIVRCWLVFIHSGSICGKMCAKKINKLQKVYFSKFYGKVCVISIYLFIYLPLILHIAIQFFMFVYIVTFSICLCRQQLTWIFQVSWLFFRLIWKNYVLYWDFNSKSWIVDFFTRFTREKTPQNNFSQ